MFEIKYCPRITIQIKTCGQRRSDRTMKKCNSKLLGKGVFALPVAVKVFFSYDLLERVACYRGWFTINVY